MTTGISNQSKCDILREAGVAVGQLAYADRSGMSKLSIDERNAVKELCLTCPYDECIHIDERSYTKGETK